MQEGLSLQVVGGRAGVRVEDHDDVVAVGVGDGGRRNGSGAVAKRNTMKTVVMASRPTQGN